MKKYISLAILLAAGTALANAETYNLSLDYGTLIGGYNNQSASGNNATVATVTKDSFTSATTYSAWENILTESGEWYIQKGCNLNVGGGTKTADAVTLVAGGPNVTSACGAIRFEVASALFADVADVVTFSFDVLRTAGNNNKNHTLDFALYSSNASVPAMESLTYNSKEGENLLTTKQTVSFTITKEMANAIATDGETAKFAFSVLSNEVTGSNTIVTMNNFKFDGVSPIPEPSAFGLLAGLGALALVGMRRRRR